MNTALEKQPEVVREWTEANPKFKYGEPMLAEDDIQNTGTSIVALHEYYMEGCLMKQKNK